MAKRKYNKSCYTKKKYYKRKSYRGRKSRSRPLTQYNRFVSEYIKSEHRSGSARPVMAAAAAEWRRRGCIGNQNQTPCRSFKN